MHQILQGILHENQFRWNGWYNKDQVNPSSWAYEHLRLPLKQQARHTPTIPFYLSSLENLGFKDNII